MTTGGTEQAIDVEGIIEHAQGATAHTIETLIKRAPRARLRSGLLLRNNCQTK